MDGPWDAVVVGCGPVGALAAGRLARRGHRTLIVEEHHEVGRPVQCAGLVTRKLFEGFGARAQESILNSVTGAELFSPGGRSLSIGGEKERAVVIDRALLDRIAAEEAVDAGCSIHLGTRVTAISITGTEAVLSTDGLHGKQQLRARVVVGADGPASTVARACGLPAPPEILPGFEAEFSGIECPEDNVKIFFGRDIVPGFFGWLIPQGGGKGILGLCCQPGPLSARERLGNLMKNPNVKRWTRNARVVRYMAGSVPLALAKRTYSERVVTVGDAAGQVKPISGGGLYTGTRCANICAEVLGGALEKDDLSAKGLSKYEKAWKAAPVGKEMSVGRRIRKAFVNVSDKQMDELVRMLDKPKLLALISVRGDIDAPSKFAKLLFRQAPGLLKFSGPFVKSLFQ